MKRIGLTFTIILLCLNNFAQIDYDYIKYCDYYIARLDSNSSKSSRINLCNIKNINFAEQYFGSGYKITRYYDNLFAGNFITLNYNDGLEIRIDEDHKTFFTFKISSKNYLLVLSNGRTIKIGMSLIELMEIFPKSFSKQNTEYITKSDLGKKRYRIWLTIINDNKTIVTGDGIIFIINKEGELEEIDSYKAG
jgi:hypothetical protein